MSQLNCLQCRHCQLLPETDFSKRGTVIHCEWTNRHSKMVTGPRPLNLEGCPRAQPMPKIGLGYYSSAVAVAFLAYWWPRITRPSQRDKILMYMGKSRHAIRGIALAHSISFPAIDCRKTPTAVRKNSFTPEQAEFLLSHYKDDFWPRCFQKGDTKIEMKARNAHIRTVLMEGVAERGPARTWVGISMWMKRQTGVLCARRRNEPIS